MSVKLTFTVVFMLLLLPTTPLFAAGESQPEESGTIFTFWPFVDYRESPREGYSNLAILGPLFKWQQKGDDRDVAMRPLFYSTANSRNESASVEYLYPIASSETRPDVTTLQVLKLFKKNIYRKDEGDEQERSSMLFPFYINGESRKYGPYTSVFPFYGDIYERFWRDEYHYVLFPLYGRTVNKGTTTRNYLYPFFATINGDKESGFQFWPLYGQASKEGVYSRRFALWPFLLKEQTGLNTDNPTRRLHILPLYAAVDSPQRTARFYLWPFFGHTTDNVKKEEAWNYFWPFWRTVRGEQRNVTSILPFYYDEHTKETSKRWYMWPLYKHEEINSEQFRQERDRLLYFLYSDNRESWPNADGERRRTALWPLFVFNRDVRGVKSITLPAPVEPVLNRDGIERNWAPFWRLYQQKWNDQGDSAVSFLWNLYWHEARGNALACEFFPLLSYHKEERLTEFRLLKGLIGYRDSGENRRLTLFWLPFGITWSKTAQDPAAAAGTVAGGEP
jgi:hypothetical protein